MGVRTGPWFCAYNNRGKPLGWTISRSEKATIIRLLRNVCKDIKMEKWARLERRGYKIKKVKIVEDVPI